jgi:ribosome-binding protein aMBF1 (putative translation factor)
MDSRNNILFWDIPKGDLLKFPAWQGPGDSMEKSVFTARYAMLLRCLIEARKQAGLTQTQLAARLGRPQSFVSKVEQGQRRLDVVEFLEVAHAIGADSHAIIKAVEGISTP